MCRVKPYTINILSWFPSLHLFGNLILEAVRKTERVKFILDVTPWQKTKDKFGPYVWIEVTKNVQVLQSEIKQQVKGEQRASAWEVINMCGRLEMISNTNVNRKSEAGGRKLSLFCIIKTFLSATIRACLALFNCYGIYDAVDYTNMQKQKWWGIFLAFSYALILIFSIPF